MNQSSLLRNAFTVDVEDYFQVEAFARVIDRGSWDEFSTRVVANTSRLLDMLAAREIRAEPFRPGLPAGAAARRRRRALCGSRKRRLGHAQGH